MADYDARDVLDKYITKLGALGTTVIRDVSDLDHPKDIIKYVLQHCLRTIESSDQREFLRQAYLSLASFQVLSEAESKAVGLLNEMAPLARPGEEMLEAQASRLGPVAGALEAVFGRLKTESIILGQELRTLTGAATSA